MKSSNFDINRLKCKCGCCKKGFPSAEIEENLASLCAELEKLQAVINCFVIINSGYRCKSHNTKCGGVKHSQHLLGLAADISVKGISANALSNMIFNYRLDYNSKINMIILYDSFVHIDIRKGPFQFINKQRLFHV